ncbi:unnamed protein product [Arctogadus glacialis]
MTTWEEDGGCGGGERHRCTSLGEQHGRFLLLILGGEGGELDALAVLSPIPSLGNPPRRQGLLHGQMLQPGPNHSPPPPPPPSLDAFTPPSTPPSKLLPSNLIIFSFILLRFSTFCHRH